MNALDLDPTPGVLEDSVDIPEIPHNLVDLEYLGDIVAFPDAFATACRRLLVPFPNILCAAGNLLPKDLPDHLLAIVGLVVDDLLPMDMFGDIDLVVVVPTDIVGDTDLAVVVVVLSNIPDDAGNPIPKDLPDHNLLPTADFGVHHLHPMYMVGDIDDSCLPEDSHNLPASCLDFFFFTL